MVILLIQQLPVEQSSAQHPEVSQLIPVVMSQRPQSAYALLGLLQLTLVHVVSLQFLYLTIAKKYYV